MKRGSGDFPGTVKGYLSERGIALLMVLWVLTILMVIVLSFSFMTRTETIAALSFKGGSEKKFIAEAGIERGIMEIYYRKQNLAVEDSDVWATDGTPYSDSFGGGNYTVKITDESGKIDINMLTDASGIILKNLLMNSGVDEENADTIVDSVLDWKDPNSGAMQRLNGAGDDYYMSLPNPYKAKHANFDTLEELLLVKGVTPAILYGTDENSGIIAFLTVYSKMGGVNINAAPKEVLTAIPGITPEIADAIINFRENTRITNLQQFGIPPQSNQYITLGESSTFTIEAVGNKGDGKVGYGIKATVNIGPNGDVPYTYLYYKKPVSVKQ